MIDEVSKVSSGQNVFEMVAALGRAGMWVRRVTWGNTCARVVAMGEVAGPAPYFGNPSVLMDVYTLDGTLKEELAQLLVPGTYKTWRRWPEPVWVAKITLRALDDPQIANALHALDKKRHKLPSTQHTGSKHGEKALGKRFDDERVHLSVSYARKDEAKKIGARWAAETNSWWLSTNAHDALEQARKLGFLKN